MSIIGFDWLVRDVKDPSLLLGICLVLLFLNKQMTRPRESYLLRWRLALGLILCGFVFMFGVLLYQDRGLLEATWHRTPFLCLLLCFASVALVLLVALGIAYWQLLPPRSKNVSQHSAP